MNPNANRLEPSHAVTLPQDSPQTRVWPVRRIICEALLLVVGLALIGWALLVPRDWMIRHTMRDNWVQHPSHLVLGQIWRVLIGSAGVLLAFFVRPRVGAALARHRAGTIAAQSLAIAGAVLAALGTSEWILRRTIPADPTPELTLTAGDSKLGWDYPREKVVILSPERPVYAFGPDGDRVDNLDHPIDPERPALVFLGESIAMGWGLPYRDTLPGIVGKNTGLRAIDLAVQGYSTQQSYLKFRDVLPRLRHPVAVVTTFLPVQLRRNVDSYRVHLAPDPTGDLIPIPAVSSLWKDLHLRHICETVMPFHWDDPVPITAAVLRAIAKAAKERGAFPLFVILIHGHPPGFDPPEDDPLLRELFTDQGLAKVVVHMDPKWNLPGDLNHPSRVGTSLIASSVERALRSAGVVF